MSLINLLRECVHNSYIRYKMRLMVLPYFMELKKSFISFSKYKSRVIYLKVNKFEMQIN